MIPARDLVVPPEAAGARLDAWLAQALADVSRAAAAGLIDSGAVLVDGSRRPKSTRLQGGEHGARRGAGRDPGAAPPAEPEVVWEGEPCGGRQAARHRGPPGARPPRHDARRVAGRAADPAGSPHAVHRLDRDTSGLMLGARRATARATSSRRRCASGEVLREYLALVDGAARRAHRHDRRADRPRRAAADAHVDPHGHSREARTHFEVDRFAGRTRYVRARLETGRTHQIRAHFAAIGHPLAGDRGLRGGRRARPRAPVPPQRALASAAECAYLRTSPRPDRASSNLGASPEIDLIRSAGRWAQRINRVTTLGLNGEGRGAVAPPRLPSGSLGPCRR